MNYRAYPQNDLNGGDWLTNRKLPSGVDARRKARRQAASNAAVSSKLKQIYGAVVREPLPDRFAVLLDRLDKLGVDNA